MVVQDIQHIKLQGSRKLETKITEKSLESVSTKKSEWFPELNLTANECGECSKIFATNRELVGHIRKRHERNASKYYKCPKCEYQTFRQLDFENHKCNKSSLKFLTSNIYDKISSKINNMFWRPKASFCNSQEIWTTSLASQSSKEEKFQCPFCRFRTDRDCLMQNHLHCHVGPNMKRCPYCRFTGEETDVLNHILRDELNKLLSCTTCFFLTASKQYLDLHMNAHKDGSGFCCRHCGYAFATLYELKFHESIHTNVKDSDSNEILLPNLTRQLRLSASGSTEKEVNVTRISAPLQPLLVPNASEAHISSSHNGEKDDASKPELLNSVFS